MEKIKIIAIVGSLRRDSYNRQLAMEAGRIIRDQVIDEVSGGAELELLDYGDVPLLNQDNEYPAPDAVRWVRGVIKSAGGVWFFTPEYNHFFPGVLKNLIDWLSRPISESEGQVLRGKPAALSGITPGMSGTGIAQDHLVTLISFLNMKVMNQPRLVIPNAMQQTDQNGRLSLGFSAPLLEQQVKAFLHFIKN